MDTAEITRSLKTSKYPDISLTCACYFDHHCRPQISLQLGLESVTNMSKDLANISKKNKALSKRWGAEEPVAFHKA